MKEPQPHGVQSDLRYGFISNYFKYFALLLFLVQILVSCFLNLFLIVDEDYLIVFFKFFSVKSKFKFFNAVDIRCCNICFNELTAPKYFI